MTSRVRVGKKRQVTVPRELCTRVNWSIGQDAYGRICEGTLLLAPERRESEDHHAVRLRERNQITLPIAVCRTLGISEMDFIEIEIRQGSLVLIPHVVTEPGLRRLTSAQSEHPPAAPSFRPLEKLEQLAKRSRRVAAKRIRKT
jgi:bifunctional DNA-binding transcriptional regulator/antitoxin component of YhaV-PrlF toxin-antitoxin module